MNLIQPLRDRVHNFELTECSLARVTGISQPHLRNVLKGKRLLSLQKRNQIFSYLELDLIDLIRQLEPEERG
jgi:hypothetical protein